MTIQFIDHALNAVLTGLIYGSEAWIVSAFGFYVATQEYSTPSADFEAVAVGEVGEEAIKEAVERASEAAAQVITDEKDIVQEQDFPKKSTVLEKATAGKKNTAKEPTKAPSVAKPPPILTYSMEPVQITCEPVNWKKWKVGDLRKANLAHACGVRVRPVGSRRNLTKTDLIAQYEQQLKRYTKVPNTRKTIQRKRTIA